MSENTNSTNWGHHPDQVDTFELKISVSILAEFTNTIFKEVRQHSHPNLFQIWVRFLHFLRDSLFVKLNCTNAAKLIFGANFFFKFKRNYFLLNTATLDISCHDVIVFHFYQHMLEHRNPSQCYEVLVKDTKNSRGI